MFPLQPLDGLFDREEPRLALDPPADRLRLDRVFPAVRAIKVRTESNSRHRTNVVPLDSGCEGILGWEGDGAWLLETPCLPGYQPDRARSFITEAERIAGMWQGGPWTGAVWEARGVLRLAEGEDAQARAMFREAADAFAGAGNRSDADRCLEAAGRLGSP
jgi:hypothetical protein